MTTQSEARRALEIRDTINNFGNNVNRGPCSLETWLIRDRTSFFDYLSQKRNRFLTASVAVSDIRKYHLLERFLNSLATTQRPEISIPRINADEVHISVRVLTSEILETKLYGYC